MERVQDRSQIVTFRVPEFEVMDRAILGETHDYRVVACPHADRMDKRRKRSALSGDRADIVR